MDGWIRYYTGKTKKGYSYITCVVLVRGNWFIIIVAAALGGISLIFFTSVKKMTEKKFTILAVIMTIATSLWCYFVLKTGWVSTIFVAIFSGACWILVKFLIGSSKKISLLELRIRQGYFLLV